MAKNSTAKKGTIKNKGSKYQYNNVLVEQRKDGITFLTLNRPEKRNAMSPELHHEMDDALEHLAVDADTKLVILTGAGKAFCAGQDLKTYFRGLSNDPVARSRAAAASESWRSYRLIGFPKPTIAMVNGFVFGGGLTPIVSCDVAIASNDAVFGISEINWGHIPGGLVGWNVNQVMSFRDAMWYSISGDTFNGKEAAQMKFVNFSVPHTRLKSETLKIARKLLKKNPWAIRYTKEAIRSVRDMNMEQAADYLRCKSDALQRVDKEQGRQEGMKQFLDEKTFRPGVGTYKRK
ncbi:MAG: p-hydroxycinnamoyl CoA hydratase/lyase [Rhodospirillaceae bacterium]|nr:p-hydroxycinnamoyl CoA hydratase/lyase [Rhodospirillaceae bacterium]